MLFSAGPGEGNFALVGHLTFFSFEIRTFSGDILVVTTERCFWLLMDRGQGYCLDILQYSRQFSITKKDLASNIISAKVETFL